MESIRPVLSISSEPLSLFLHFSTGQRYTVYSKKFAEKGTFEDNTGNNAFSLPPSTIYTERWEIWIMSSANSNLVDNTLIWDSFGSNAEDRAEANGTAETNLDKYYHCEVNRQKLPCRERSLFASCRGALYIFRDTAGNFYPAEASFQTCAGLKFSVQH